jgi:hypothetical protein
LGLLRIAISPLRTTMKPLSPCAAERQEQERGRRRRQLLLKHKICRTICVGLWLLRDAV